MIQNPSVLTKAQADIDRIVGQDRLPDFGDRKALPYLEAIVKEVLRWRLVTPLGKCVSNLFQASKPHA